MSEAELLSVEVGREDAGGRLDQVAARLFPDYSRAKLQGWIREGRLLVDGAKARPRDSVASGARQIGHPDLDVGRAVPSGHV